MKCPLCGNETFAPYRNRQNARCTECGAKERERLMGMILQKTDIDAQGKPVYHFAPETQLRHYLRQRFGALYQAADISPELYEAEGFPVQRVDLSRPREYFEPQSIGGIVHSHVLEHIPASVDRVIRELNEALVPGGFHIFQVPIHEGWSREDMDPDLSTDIRLERFYQEDHIRVFGSRDFADRVLSLFDDGFQQTDTSTLVTKEDAQGAAIPYSALSRPTGHSVFLFRKVD